MTIKELLKVLSQAPDMNSKVYIPEIQEQGDWGHQASTTQIHWNYDDNGDLELSPGVNRE